MTLSRATKTSRSRSRDFHLKYALFISCTCCRICARRPWLCAVVLTIWGWVCAAPQRVDSVRFAGSEVYQRSGWHWWRAVWHQRHARSYRCLRARGWSLGKRFIAIDMIDVLMLWGLNDPKINMDFQVQQLMLRLFDVFRQR